MSSLMFPTGQMMPRGRQPGLGVPPFYSPTVYVSAGQRQYEINHQILKQYLPNFDAFWDPRRSLTAPEIDDMYIDDETLDVAWEFLINHIYAAQHRQPGSSLVEQLQSWWEQVGVSYERDFDGGLSLPMVIRALGSLLSPDVLGCSAMLGPLQTLLSWTLDDPPCRDPYLLAATLSTICDVGEEDPSKLNGAIGIIHTNPNASDIVRWALNEPICQQFCPLSKDLLKALRIRSSQVPVLVPQAIFQPQSRPRRQTPARLALAAPHPFVLGPGAMTPGLVGPPAMRRPPVRVRSRSTPAIKGSHLPTDVLMNVAYYHPDKVKVDSQALFDDVRPVRHHHHHHHQQRPMQMPMLLGPGMI